MQKTFSLFAIVALSCTVVARAVNLATEAPADEYFGPHKQSILDIRNRLNRYDAFGDRSALDRRSVGALDSLHVSIADWQHKYPRDPWLPHSLRHLLHEYCRAGAARSAGARQTLGLMKLAYPRSPETIAITHEIALSGRERKSRS
jgi:hypothetical protein